MDQKRIENVSKMIRLLSGNTQYEMSEIARKLEVSQRSAYRYLDTLMMAGYEIHKVRGSIYKMDSLPLAWVGNGNVFQFTDQEPFSFSADFAYVWAYDLDDCRNKLFKIQRIGSVAMMDRKWQHKKEHVMERTDIFGFGIKEPLLLELKLSNKAKVFLLEEYPRAEEFLQLTEGGWVLKTEVGSMDPVRRFCGGFPGEVELVMAGVKDYDITTKIMEIRGNL